LKLNKDDLQDTLQGLMASAVLLLMRKLREQKYQQFHPSQKDGTSGDRVNYLPYSQLHSILSKMVSRIMMVDSTLSTRGNLYAALLNYLQFTHRPFLHMPKVGKYVTPSPCLLLLRVILNLLVRRTRHVKSRSPTKYTPNGLNSNTAIKTSSQELERG
jgi:hypothetical protein